MRTKAILSIFFVITALLVVAQTSSIIPNLNSPRSYVYTAGQPDEEGFQQLSKMGVRTVINVLPERKCLPEERELVTSHNMVYRSVPFEMSAFRLQTVDYFAEVLKTSDKPVLIHCSTGNHVGGLWFAYRVLHENATLEQALLEGRAIGMRPQLEEPLFKWVVAQRLR